MSEEKFQGRMHGPQFEPDEKEGVLTRLLYMVLIWVMLQLSLSILGAVTLVQFVIALAQKGRQNERLAELGESLGIWMAKSARYLAMASDVKPWPWTDLD